MFLIVSTQLSALRRVCVCEVERDSNLGGSQPSNGRVGLSCCAHFLKRFLCKCGANFCAHFCFFLFPRYTFLSLYHALSVDATIYLSFSFCACVFIMRHKVCNVILRLMNFSTLYNSELLLLLLLLLVTAGSRVGVGGLDINVIRAV